MGSHGDDDDETVAESIAALLAEGLITIKCDGAGTPVLRDGQVVFVATSKGRAYVAREADRGSGPPGGD